MSAAGRAEPVIVKRYARSRFYDIAGQRYVTAEQLRSWAAGGIIFAVIDTETDSEVTRILLA